MDNPSLIGALAAFTLVAALLAGAWQIARTRKSQAAHGEKPTGGADTLLNRDSPNQPR